ncbi:PAS domain S-box protein [uncultured Desulfatiglans sp.]|uniref:histidine kinase n=1 Tax=Uncultured Desulfatiglans sp. TaxID=1748965 RepID=A0A653A075_UNCDX|nr:PAS domain S-box protein [uncultured Desulfatiglans sp.]
MNTYREARQQDLKRRRRERYLIVGLFVLISGLVYYGTRFLDMGPDISLSNSILIFALININVILLLLLVFLTLRNLVKLLFERRKRIMGARLRSKLVLAFVTLSLLPTIILFFVSVQFISSSIEYWFNVQIEQSLKNALEVGQEYYSRTAEEILQLGNGLSRVITYEGFLQPEQGDRLEKLIADKQKEYGLASIRVYTETLLPKSASTDQRLDLSGFEGPGAESLRRSLDLGTDSQDIESSSHGDLVSGIIPIFSGAETRAVVGLIVLGKFVPATFVNRLKAISSGLQEYRQLKMLKKPIKISHMITLSIVTLLIIFSSVWFGFYLSKEITIPIQELAEGTNRIASGDYSFFIDLESTDEIGVLVNSFNRMTLDLKNSKEKLEEANRELVKSNIELEQRRQYMEFVLANVAAGVVSADANGKILTINKSAEKMLNIEAEHIIGKSYKEVLDQDYINIVDGFLGDRRLFAKGFLKKQIRLSAGGSRLTLLVSLNVLRDDQGRYLGLVAVFEDLSEIEKAQRMAAWREVARRIAHEVKNPLTPIQLSAQRLKKRYGEKLSGEDYRIFNECTEMIVRQVEELKGLVNEFSNFARMPAANRAPADLRGIVEESLSLYREAHREVAFRFEDAPEFPVFPLDREQMKRVFINLLDNAIEAVERDGEITVRFAFDAVQQVVRIEVADNGKGVSPDHRSKLFEPYFSTKKHGTGLGLAIVNTIVNDHDGFIRVEKNVPRGTRFIIELPVRA